MHSLTEPPDYPGVFWTQQENIDKFFLVSGDGDYFRLVNFLREENKLGKVLFPSHHNASSLYRKIESRYRVYLDSEDIKRKIAYTKY